MRVLLLTAALIAAVSLASAQAIQYCGTAGVSYVLQNPNDRAGFVWETNTADITCALATTANGFSTGIRVNAYCAFFDANNYEYAETIMQELPTNGYYAGSLQVNCPVGSRVQVAVGNIYAQQSVPINVTFNFVGTNGEVKTPMFRPFH